MHSSLSRLQKTTNHAITVIFAITLFIAISSYLQLHNDGFHSVVSSISVPTTSHSFRTSRVFGSSNRDKKENIKIDQVSLTADLSPLFNYNTKQVFVYLTYEYPGYNGLSTSKVTFWDKIVKTKEDAVIDLSDLKGKYSCWDYGSGSNFTSYDGTMKLEWNIQPNVGLLLWGETQGGIPVNL